MLRYYLGRAACILTSLLLAASVVAVTLCGMTVGFFKSQSFIKNNCMPCSEAVIADIDTAAAGAAVAASLPEDAFAGAVNNENFSVVADEIARMFSYRYAADYTESTAIYELFFNRLTDYSNKNSLGLKQEELESAASLAVSYVNFRLSGNDSKQVKLFNFAADAKALYLLIGGVAVFAACIVALELLNHGRHRKFSFIGMGFMTAGYLLMLVPLALRMSGILERYRFCVYQPYDDIVRLCHQSLLQWLMLAGVPMLVAGVVMLLINYRYYAKKLKKARASREDYDKLKEDFMETPKPPKPRKEGEELERHVMKIDFEEE